MEKLIQELKIEIIDLLNLEDIDISELDTDEPLFGDKFGLSSIDGLELIVLLEKKYHLKIYTAEEGKKIFYSVRTIAEYIVQEQNKLNG